MRYLLTSRVFVTFCTSENSRGRILNELQVDNVSIRKIIEKTVAGTMMIRKH